MRKLPFRSQLSAFSFPLLLLPLAAALWIFVVWQTWSFSPFWPDADGYTSHVAEGRWVAHPPGYLIFVALGHGFHASGLPAYSAVQAACLLLTVAALPALYLLFRRVCSPTESLWLLAAFAFSNNVLILSRTGTSHAADYLTVTVLLLTATSRGFRAGQFWPCFAFAAAFVACAGFRFTTAIMMAPLTAVVLVRNWRHASLWICLILAGLAIIALQTSVIRLSGGWIPYSEYSRSMHLGNLPSSPILSGLNAPTLLNIARTVGWWGMSVLAVLVIPLIALRNQKKTPSTITIDQTELLIYGGTSAAGCLGMSALYLCTHPGYVSAALPGTFACLAALVPFAGCIRPAALTAIILSLGFFLVARPFDRPSTPAEAVANGLILQYSGGAIKSSIFQTTSGWLKRSGFKNFIPERRQKELSAADAKVKITP